MGDPLRARLFGYGVPYRVEVDAAGLVEPKPTDAASEAERLCRALRQLRGGARLRATGRIRCLLGAAGYKGGPASISSPTSVLRRI